MLRNDICYDMLVYLKIVAKTDD
uniref:Tubby-like F-box protein n=1 Tax=Rhizophora mucronata TaxID=61149 RepID=A0A2P2MFM6_RHIMU